LQAIFRRRSWTCVVHQVIEDDLKVMRITSGWDTTVPAGRAVIIVKSALAAAAPVSAPT
jgi:hypothetical protein